MNRIAFIKSILAKGLLVSLPFNGKSKEDKLARILLYRHHVAGFQYGDGVRLVEKMKEGDELLLVREPENIHDEDAVAVYWKQHRIGYVPAVDNEMPNNFLLRGLSLIARVDSLNKTAKPWQMCEAGIYLLYPKNLLQKNKP